MRTIYVSSRLAPADADFVKGVGEVAASPQDAQTQLGHRFPARLVHRDRDEVSVHAPSGDGASGPLGHLGRCLGRVAR